MNHPFHHKSLLSLFAFAITAMAVQAAKVEETTVHQIPAQNLTLVDLSNVNGSIQCVGKDTDVVELVCTLKASADSKTSAQAYLDKIVIDIKEEGNVLHVNTRLPKKSGSGFWKWIAGKSVNASVDYVLNVPKAMAVDLESVNGSVTVNDLSGKVKLETVNGGVRAKGISAAANVQTVNGSVHCEFTEALTLQDMSFGTVNGSIKVFLPDTAAFTISVETVNGGINCDFDLSSDAVKKRRHLSGSVNGGGPRLSFETVNGSVGVHRRG